MAENKLADMSTEFAVKILNLIDGSEDIIPYPTNLKEAARALARISERLSMLIARRILLPSCKYPSKNAMKRNADSYL